MLHGCQQVFIHPCLMHIGHGVGGAELISLWLTVIAGRKIKQNEADEACAFEPRWLLDGNSIVKADWVISALSLERRRIRRGEGRSDQTAVERKEKKNANKADSICQNEQRAERTDPGRRGRECGTPAATVRIGSVTYASSLGADGVCGGCAHAATHKHKRHGLTQRNTHQQGSKLDGQIKIWLPFCGQGEKNQHGLLKQRSRGGLKRRVH